MAHDTQKRDDEIVEFGGVTGALLLTLLIPLGAIALNVISDESQSTVLKKHQNTEVFFDLGVFTTYVTFRMVHIIAKALPFGGPNVVALTSKNVAYKHRANESLPLIATFSICAALEAAQVHVFSYVYHHHFGFLLSAVIFGFVMSVCVYIASFCSDEGTPNAHLHRNPIYGFFIGRQTNPKVLGTVDLKFSAFLSLHLAALVLNTAILSENVRNSSNINETLLVIYVTQTVYLIDVVFHEAAWLTTFEIQYEGFGYMLAMGYSVYPFMITSLTKYVYERNVRLPMWLLIAHIILFLVGYAFYRGSNNQKDTYKKNPNKNRHFEVITHKNGGELLVGGFWGFVRHPNYLGDMMMNISWIPFVFCAPPAIVPISSLLLLIHRTVRINRRCQTKYGATWKKYCDKVKYKLIPKVY